MSKKPATPHKVAYREGGTHRFRWTLILEDFPTLAQAVEAAGDIERGGYKTLISPPGGFRHGLPETWDPSQSPCDFMWHRGWLVPARGDWKCPLCGQVVEDGMPCGCGAHA